MSCGTAREARAAGVMVGRGSHVEHGELAGTDIVDRYVHPLGGDLQIVPTSGGDEQIKVG